jgi:hypothetical protein
MESRPVEWEEFEEPILRWVAEKVGYDEQVTLNRSPPYERDRDLDRPDSEIIEALRRLIEHGLVSAGHVVETAGGWHYTRLRVTADGYRVLGEWPPSPELTANEMLADVVRRLAGNAVSSDDEGRLLRRTAGALARFTASTVIEAALDELSAGGEDIDK